MTTTYAGMDAHARTIRVAVLAPGAGKPEEWQLTNEPRSVKRLAQRLKRMAPGPVVACYEAGPGGFALQRQLEAAGRWFSPTPYFRSRIAFSISAWRRWSASSSSISPARSLMKAW